MLDVPAKRGFGEASDTRGLTVDAWSCDLLLVDGTTDGAVVATVVDNGTRVVDAIESCATVFCMDAETGTAVDLTLGVTESTV